MMDMFRETHRHTLTHHHHMNINIHEAGDENRHTQRHTQAGPDICTVKTGTHLRSH